MLAHPLGGGLNMGWRVWSLQSEELVQSNNGRIDGKSFTQFSIPAGHVVHIVITDGMEDLLKEHNILWYITITDVFSSYKRFLSHIPFIILNLAAIELWYFDAFSPEIITTNGLFLLLFTNVEYHEKANKFMSS